ncbi:MAG: HAD-IIIC family phosphatase [Rhodothermales bacterium]|nr:HAD-IIIC family phosphatase [Rhodothermales bacterium]
MHADPAPSTGAHIALAATFTAEPVAGPLQFWMDQLGLAGSVAFAPYNQVLQHLYAVNGQAVALHVLLVRLEDWMPEAATNAMAGNDLPLPARLLQNIDECIAAVRRAAGQRPTPYLIVLCPPSPAVVALPSLATAIGLAEASIAEQLNTLPNVDVVRSETWVERYKVGDYHNRFADHTAHIPYTDVAFSAIATCIARRLSALQRRPFKVIVVDCDNTLWQGVCGEVGPRGVAVDAPFAAFQDLLIRQQAEGMLLCLCSKNSEADVWAVFDEQPAMRLKREHLVSWRINWRPKSENLRALAAELDLGLDSFIFIDDNPVECAEVAAQCPEVLTVQVPADARRLLTLLDHLWVLDRYHVTDEDRRRAEHYRSNLQRSQLQEAAPTLAGFLERLDLRIAIAEPAESQYTRIAQLTQRTNQFNASGIRRSMEQVAGLLLAGKREARVVDVSDRFGDYGLVGAVLFTSDDEALLVETLLLSCRALGRSVEQRMAIHLGEAALQRGLRFVDIAYIETPRNLPVRQFLENTGAENRLDQGDHVIYRFDARRLAHMDPIAAAAVAPADDEAPATSPQTTRVARSTDRTPWLRIATEWSDMQALAERLNQIRLQRPDLQTPFAPLQTPLERQIAGIWETVLGIDGIGAVDGFSELGGSSLQLVQIHARIQEQLGRSLPLTQLFALPTVRAQAGFFTPPAAAASSAQTSTLTSIQERAQRQKAAMNKHKILQYRQK